MILSFHPKKTILALTSVRLWISFLVLLAGLIIIPGRIKAQVNITYLEYYVDTDPGWGNGTSVPITPATEISNLSIPLNVDSLTPGVHRFFVRARDANGAWSMVNMLFFYRPIVNPSSVDSLLPPSNIEYVEYYMDNDPGYGRGASVSIQPGTDIANLVIPVNVDTLSPGVHRFFLRARNAAGSWSMENILFFYRPIVNPNSVDSLLPPSNIARIEYYFDNDPGYGNAISVPFTPGTDLNNLVIVSDISRLTAGFHKVFVRAMNANGKWSMINFREFEVLDSIVIRVGQLDSSVCAGSPFRVPFTVLAARNPGNIFRAELSDSTGSFANPVTIGSLSGINADTINAVIPAGTLRGSFYRLRVISSLPADTSTVSITAVAVKRNPGTSYFIEGDTTTCQISKNYRSSYTDPEAIYAWQLSGGGLLSGTGRDVSVNWTDTGVFTISLGITNSCGSGNQVQLPVRVTLADTPVISSSGPLSFCQGGSVILSSSAFSGNTWNTGSSSRNITVSQSGNYTVTSGSTACRITSLPVTVVVIPSLSGTFTPIASLCKGNTPPSLPTVSSNNISGSWSPSQVDNQVSGVYVFTPDTGSCKVSTSVNIAVTQPVVPVFSINTTVALGSTAPVLPAVSQNGIIGTWNLPSISNTISDSYVFTPASGQCATALTLNVTVQSYPDVAVQQVQSDDTLVSSLERVAVRWKIANVGSAPAVGNWRERIYMQSDDGSTRVLLKEVNYSSSQSLPAGSVLDRSDTVSMPLQLNIGDRGYFVVEIIPGSGLQEASGAQGNNISIQLNSWKVLKELIVQLSGDSLEEGGSGGLSVRIMRTGSLNQPLDVFISYGQPARYSGLNFLTIPAGQAVRSFTLFATNNSISEGTISDSISISAAGFPISQKRIIILDDDKATLTITQLSDTVTEGGTLTLRVNTNLPSALPIQVFFSSTNPSRLVLPTSVLIPAGSTFADVSTAQPQDVIPENEIMSIITASAASHFPVSANVYLKDDDVPGLQLELQTNLVNESGGLYATVATLRRVPGTSNIGFTANITASPSNNLILPATVSFAQGENFKTFNVGVIDNALAEGDRQVNISAGVFINSCNCSATLGTTGYTSAALTVTDNDGPAIQLSVTNLSLAEGLANAGILRVGRNTSNDTALTVWLLVSDTTEVRLPAFVTIPVGSAFIEVPVLTINDSITDGNQQVNLVGSASGFSSGSTWVIVTDQNKPDFLLPSVSLSNNSVQGGQVFNYQVAIKNAGLAPSLSGLVLYGYLSADNVVDQSDSLIITQVYNGSIPVGQTITIINALSIPDLPGNYRLILHVNPLSAQTELIYTNNYSTPVDLSITPAYTAKAFTDQAYYLRGNAVSIYGNAVMSNGLPAVQKQVEVYIFTNGLRRTLISTTDSSGNYVAQFVPLANESGTYFIGASYPGLNAGVLSDTFNILGLRFNNGQALRFLFSLGDTLYGNISVENLSSIPLHDLRLDPVTLPGGAVFVFDTLQLLPSNGTGSIGYRIWGTSVTPGQNFQLAEHQAMAMEISIQLLGMAYFCKAPDALLVPSHSSLNIKTSGSGQSRIVEIKIRNEGSVSSGNVQISIPQAAWLSLVSPASIPNLQPGDSFLVILSFQGTQDIPFNYVLNGNFVISCQYGNSLNIPFSFEKVSATTGTARITVTNQYTYLTAAAPNLSNARVIITHAYTGVVYADGYSDSSGIYLASGIPEGTHRIIVEKAQHNAFSGTVSINPGDTVNKIVFLNFQAITFNWSVVPTAVQDQYSVTLTAVFQTNVPVPVVIIQMPDSLPALFGTETYAFNAILTNHGLITAKDVTLRLPNYDPEYEFITNYVPADLLAQQSIQVPVIMRRRQVGGMPASQAPSIAAISDFLGISSPSSNATNSGLSCKLFTSVIYWYKCNISTGLWQNTGVTTPVSFRLCPVRGQGSNNDLGYFSNVDITAGPYDCAVCDFFNTPASASSSSSPVGITETKSCVDCLNDIAEAAGSCLPIPYLPPKPFSSSPPPLSEFIKDLAKAALGSIPGAGEPICLNDLGNAIRTCKQSFDQISTGYSGIIAGSPSLPTANINPLSSDGPSGILSRISADLEIIQSFYRSLNNYIFKQYDSLAYYESFIRFFDLVSPYTDSISIIPNPAQTSILSQMSGYDIPAFKMQEFFGRWNLSVQARMDSVFAPDSTYPNIINWQFVDTCVDSLIYTINIAELRGYASPYEMENGIRNELNAFINQGNNAVCASVKIQISQELTMTREAFEGTLDIFNGHPSLPMDSLSVNLVITDSNGIPRNDLFEIQVGQLTNIGNVTGLGTIGSQQNGIARFIFIPEIGAAPIVPQVYSFGGYVRYFDPYAGAMVSMALSPVSLTVNPSPNLSLHYFLERNILGDDALTPGVIEPSIPAELAVMIDNYGYGPAVNLMLSSAQPRIVENDKGLAINFNLIGSSLQGQPVNLGLNDINFGTIPARGTRIGQWFMTSSLLGKFVSYNADVVHNNSFNNPDLSLVQSVQLHELTHSIREYGSSDDELNDYLVNDFFDSEGIPDIIYFSQGKRTSEVKPAILGSFSGFVSPPTFTNVLTVSALDTGWNYIKLNDPGRGLYNLVSVTRNDGVRLPANNAWLSFVTLPLFGSPVYENKFYFIDTFSTILPVSYTVVWSPKNFNVPAVDSILGAPDRVSSSQVREIIVVFSKPIDATTFTKDDISLAFQGGPNLIDSSIQITRLDSVRFRIDISGLTTGNGFYNFTVQAAQVRDIYGINGTSGKNVTWTQFLTVPTVQGYIGLPAGNTAASISTVQVEFNLPVDTLTGIPDRFMIRQNGATIAPSLNIDSVSPNNRIYYLSGLQNILTNSGNYYLVVDLPSISSSGIAGLAPDSVRLTIDNEGPFVINLNKSFTGGLDAQHVTGIGIGFNENVQGFNTASVRLTRNGQQLFFNIAQLVNTGLSNWTVNDLGILTYPEGEYEFTVKPGGFTDAFGNPSVDSAKISWSVNRTSTIAVSDLSIAPDLGYSASDGVSSRKVIQVSFRLNAPASQVQIRQVDLSGGIILKTLSALDSGYHSASVTLFTGGSTSIQVNASGIPLGSAFTTKELFIDEIDLAAAWQRASGQSISRQFDSLGLLFSSRLLSDTGLAGSLILTRNNIPVSLSGIHIIPVNDSLYMLSGLRQITGSLQGNYQLKSGLSGLRKYSSGKEGGADASIDWTLVAQNNPPVANAGPDQAIISSGTYYLNGSASSDPDNDSLTFSWIAPVGVILSDSSSVNPSFNISQSDNGNTYTFLLIVNDGIAISTDLVTVTVDISVDSIGFSGLAASYCISDVPVTLLGNPTGGTFSGPGITGNLFDPSAAGAGVHVITYTRGALTKSMSTVVQSLATPLFTQVAPFCTGASPGALPAISNNGFSGSWSPAINNAATTTYTFTATAGQCASTASMTIDIIPCAVSLTVKAFIQGYQIDDSTMAPVLMNSGVAGAGSNQSDSVLIEIRDPMTGSMVAGPYSSVLSTSGITTVSITPVSGYKYLVLKSRNAIETWSAQPLLMSEAVYYDFTTAASKAFGNNQVNAKGSTYAFWSGDVNQDGTIESGDYAQMENDVMAVLFGYYPTDLTGDGAVESEDYALMENNLLQVIFVQRPF